MKPVIVVILLASLTGCAHRAEQRVTRYSATCTALGLTAGTPEHVRCMQQEAANRAARVGNALNASKVYPK